MAHRKRTLLHAEILSVLLLSCHNTTAPLEETAQNNAHESSFLPERIRVPSSFFDTYTAQTPTLEVREGPGTAFAIKSIESQSSTDFIVLDTQGTWHKVLFAPQKMGWVHKDSIKRSKDNQEINLSLRSADLPILSVRRKFLNCTDLSGQKIKLIKDTLLLSLKKAKQKVLVWIPQTGTAAWLNNKDVT